MKSQRKNKDSDETAMMTIGGHLDILRKMLFRIIFVTLTLGVVIFIFKEETFHILLAPREWNFVTYRCIEHLLNGIGYDFHFDAYHIDIISTELSAQFMTHVSTSVYLALLVASPYIAFELFRFITPALYENEKRYAVTIAIAVYLLFAIGILMSYFIIFPISFRFLGTYQVDISIINTITLSSYISTFTTLTLIMGLVFQLPVTAFFLAKIELITAHTLKQYRKHAIIVIMVIASIITPPDVFTLVLVTIPIYLLYEISILIVNKVYHTPDAAR